MWEFYSNSNNDIDDAVIIDNADITLPVSAVTQLCSFKESVHLYS